MPGLPPPRHFPTLPVLAIYFLRAHGQLTTRPRSSLARCRTAGFRGACRRLRARQWAVRSRHRGPLFARPRRRLFSSQLDLLGNAERVADFDAEVADSALELRMPEEQLDGSQVARLLVDLRRLRPTHRMRAVGGAVQPSGLDPSMDDPCILRPLGKVTLGRGKSGWAEGPRVDNPMPVFLRLSRPRKGSKWTR
jgi:hypothetical protein